MTNKPRLLVIYSVVTVVASIDYNFMDCPGNTGKLWQRTCCTGQQLPKGCECFDISKESDFTNSVSHTPSCPENLNVRFLLYTRSKRDHHTIIKVGDGSIESSQFQGSRPTKVITHGFNDKAPTPWNTDMKNALLDAEDVNVVLVDWSEASSSGLIPYVQPVANTRSVGAMIARLIQELQEKKKAPFQSFHLIGHSLGAHASGIAGKEIQRLTSQLLGRISGLDPAGPRFEKFTANVRLDKSDATFVDVIHTDIETLSALGFGIQKAIGHVDFYPNDGLNQPGCRQNSYSILFDKKPDADMNSFACSHSRSLRLFTYSISQCSYDPPQNAPACPMGYHTSTSCRGSYYPTTTGKAPYC